MKYKQVISTGCSYTNHSYETENLSRSNKLDGEYKETSFTQVLAERLGVPYTNRAFNGASISTTVLNAYEWIESNKDYVKDTLLLIGITFRGRINLWRSDSKDDYKAYYCLTPSVWSGKVDKGAIEHLQGEGDFIGESYKDVHTFGRLYWEHYYNGPKLHLQDEMILVTLEAYCESIGLDVLFVDAADESTGHVPEGYIRSKPWKDILKNVYTLPKNYPGWKSYIRDYDENYKGEHPNYNDHVELGNLLYEHIK